MKKILLTILIIFSFVAVKAQYKNQGDYLSGLKKQGKLTGKERIYNPNATGLQITKSQNQTANNGSHNPISVTSTQCNCWIPKDTSFHPVPFDGSGASGPPVAGDPNFANDDWSTFGIKLPFNFCLYGDTVGVDSTHQLFINNNGNISFGAPYSDFTAVAFPSNQYNMVAPFWGDVDTRGVGSGYVYYQLTSTHLIIQWDSVGYFMEHDDKSNTFQLIITDGTDPLLPAGYNISFCYGDMQWTTGDASMGVNGFGGVPATVGINKGDGTNYFQLSLFDSSGTAYTNPSGTPASGVDWLDYRSFLFNSCGTSNNLPPLSISNDSTICDTMNVYVVGDTLIIQRLASIPPEANQFTTLTASSPDLGSNFSVINSNPGVVASLTFRVSSNGLTLGNYYHITATSTDNGTPALSTTMNYVVHVLDSSSAVTGIKTITDKQISIYPNPNTGSFVVETNNTKQFMQVYDVTGKVVLSKTITEKTTIDACSLNEGVYNVSLTSNKGVVNKRLVIVR
jgi:hypothetical protein